MFGYVLGFGEMYNSCTPEQLVLCVNSIITVFDKIVDTSNVFKVGLLFVNRYKSMKLDLVISSLISS